MRLIWGTYNQELTKTVKEIIDLNKEVNQLQTMLEYGGQSEKYKSDIIESLKEILNTKDEVIGQLRSEIAELKS